MSVTLTFYKVSERKPAHGEDIIWLRKTSQCGFEGFDPQEVNVEYVWSDGGSMTCGYSGEDEFEGCELKIVFGNEFADEDDLWTPVDEYWAAFDKAGL